ncbi:MAG: sulfide/dihydroorotate dehydrogenase-like FAD/NAD-binding protein [Candidatus Omnitrophica bacterium]|nr:sulfide/dihydroorotate dehydrogenase-like FAD/NAD-binding protein [Candidatus Omnitrophota bacterium]
MVEIICKKIIAYSLGTRIVQLELKSPLIAKKTLPGQFVVLMVSEKGERIPLTVVDKDEERGTITLIFQEAGFTTRSLGSLKEGDFLYALVGPLGNYTEIKNYGKVALVGGGVGIAEIYPVAKALRKENNHLITILGARTKDLLILEKELKQVSQELYVTTDDGSYGRKGFVTDVLQELLTIHYALNAIELIYAVGPVPMMKGVSQIAKDRGIKAIVSLNALMVDATGMCGCCRVTVDGKTKFSCIDGPEFEAQSIDWEELGKRTKMYQDKETHICKLYNR